jgi:predicted tellurium resistance membrane protein TerC
MFDLLTDLNAWAALVTLSVLEIVLGIDNIVFLSVLVARLDPARARRSRQIGLSLALIFRVVLLLGLVQLIGLRGAVVTIWGYALSWHDIVLISGGLFLIGKATHEMHAHVEQEALASDRAATGRPSFFLVVLQMVVIDLVFSIDSIVTAVGLAPDVRIMIAAITIAMMVMYVASEGVAGFIAAHPTTKVLALAFLVLIGVALVADGFDFHIPRGYIYFAMAFAGTVEAINIAALRKRRSRTKTGKGSQ